MRYYAAFLLSVLGCFSLHLSALSPIGEDRDIDIQIHHNPNGTLYQIDGYQNVQKADLASALERYTGGHSRSRKYIRLFPHPNTKGVMLGDLIPLFHAAHTAGIQNISLYDGDRKHYLPDPEENMFRLDLISRWEWEREATPRLKDKLWVEMMVVNFWKPFLAFFVAGGLGGWYLCFALNFKKKRTRTYIPIRFSET